MQERNLQLTRDGLINFLEFAGRRGLINKGTAGARIIACNTILGILDETEASDLSKIDIEAVIQRHRNIAAGKISPTTLKTYESRVRIALNDFIEYTKDPSSWKPGIQQRPSRAGALAPSAKKPKEVERRGAPIQPSIHIDLQIHIPPEATITQIDQIFESISRHLPLK